MKILTSRRPLFGIYAAAIVVAAAILVLADSAAVRSIVIAALIGVTGLLQMQLMFSVRSSVFVVRKEVKARHDALVQDLAAQNKRLVTLADPTKQGARLARTRSEVADLATALERRENDLAEIGESLRRVEFELTVANSGGGRDPLARYDGVSPADAADAGDR